MVAGFLQNAKRQYQDRLKDGRSITFVVGNQSADLDSMSSAILYAYFRGHEAPEGAFTKLYVPLLNIPAADIDIRPEFKYIFAQTGIQPSDLVTIDDLPKLDYIRDELPPDSTRWILVDHNKMEGHLGEIYSDRVHGVIDHHVEENTVPNDTAPEPRIIEKCGSCTSLVVKYFESDWNSLDPEIEEDVLLSKLAMASILIDTKNLKDEVKVRKADTYAADICTKKIVAGKKGWNQQGFYDEVYKAHNDIDSLPLQSILRKDYKEWRDAGISLGMSSSVKPLGFLLQKARDEANSRGDQGTDAWESEITRFMRERSLDIHSVGTLFTVEEKLRRELCLEWANKEAKERIDAFVKNAGECLELEAKHIEGIEGDCRKVFDQQNVDASRKTLAPLLRKAIRGESNL